MAARLREPVGPHLEGAEFIRFLGAGGFADVFLYRQDMPRREVAVKVIRSGASAAQKQKFQAESDLMAKFGGAPGGAFTVRRRASARWACLPHHGVLPPASPGQTIFYYFTNAGGAGFGDHH